MLRIPKVSRMATSAVRPTRSMVWTRLVPMTCSTSDGSCSDEMRQAG
jgi:hypothetical protein